MSYLENPEYWESLARDERRFAFWIRRQRHGTVESIRVHIKQAEAYEAKAAKLRAALKGQNHV